MTKTETQEMRTNWVIQHSGLLYAKHGKDAVVAVYAELLQEKTAKSAAIENVLRGGTPR